MKWTDIVSAVSSVVGNILAVIAIVIALRRKPKHKSDERGSEYSYYPEPRDSILFHESS